MNRLVFERRRNLEILTNRESIALITTHVLLIHGDGFDSKSNWSNRPWLRWQYSCNSHCQPIVVGMSLRPSNCLEELPQVTVDKKRIRPQNRWGSQKVGNGEPTRVAERFRFPHHCT
jgi:hypothetical protein